MRRAIINLPLILPLTLMACTASVDKKIPEDSNVANLNLPSSMLHTAGNKILNEKDEEVRLVGVNICSLEWKSDGDNVLASVYEAFANWNCNLVRLPLSQDRWFGKVSDYSTPNPPDGGAQYRKIVDDAVKLALSFGKYMELDLHWSNAGEWGKNIGQHYMPDDNSLEFWIDVATQYANNSAVLFDLYNEPHDITWELWRDGGTVNETENKGKSNEKNFTYNTPGYQKMINEIRALGANNIIIAGGLDWAYDLRGIASYALTDTPEGNGIVYDSHIYTIKEWDGINHDAKVLCIAGDYPVMIGEIGIGPDGQWGAAKYPSWLTDMLDWMDSNKLSWAGWCFHTAAGPSMISDWQYTPTPYHGAIIKKRLLSYPNTNAHIE
jgi:endoglucanase